MNTTTSTGPGITDEIADMMDDLTGFNPALDRVVAALGDMLTAGMNAEQSQSAIAALSGCVDSNVRTLTALVVRQLGNPDANPALADLDDTRKQTLRRLGAEHAAAIGNTDLDDTAAAMTAAISHS